MSERNYLRDQYNDPRDYATEARLIVQCLTGLLPTIEHLRALEEAHDVRIIQIANALERLKRDILKGVEL